ncbi:MAG: hypothetical protein ACRC8W_03010 [Plesiomonas shigelloides]
MSMKNGDMPAHPTGEVYFVGEDGKAKAAQGNGMTKREMIAMHAMMGLCAHSGDYHQFDHLASDAVSYADALLAELERTK